MAKTYYINDGIHNEELCVQRHTRDGNDCYCVAYFKNFRNKYELFTREKFETISKAQKWLEEYATKHELKIQNK